MIIQVKEKNSKKSQSFYWVKWQKDTYVHYSLMYLFVLSNTKALYKKKPTREVTKFSMPN